MEMWCGACAGGSPVEGSDGISGLQAPASTPKASAVINSDFTLVEQHWPETRQARSHIHMAHKILVVDDDPVQRRLVEAMLRRFGYDAKVLDDGHAAVALLRSGEERIDLVILDLFMPGLDGLGVL